MTKEQLTEHAVSLLQDQSDYMEDARVGAPLGNSVVGSLLAIRFSAPRQLTEAAVCEAVNRLMRKNGEVTIRRSGGAPITFDGELLAESDGSHQTGKEQNRWHELAVYKTAGGKFILHIAYRTRWQGELDHDEAFVFGKPENVVAKLRDYIPTSSVQGYPLGDAYTERQARLMSDIQRRYDSQVSEILSSDPTFAETVE